ncbi:MAG TPA: hypothetical protein VMV24_01960, partial [Candidatus Dormibacteraeota bacterium]|nr:hypothetical protein [Candidatus Dormibacteraeota bacterium]
ETGLQTVVTASHTRTFIDTEKSEISHHFLLDDRVGRYRDVYNITSLSRDIELAIKASNLLVDETDRTMSMPVRERGVQVDELRTIERRQIAQIVNASFIVNECIECPKRYDDCAAGIAIKIKSDADKYDGLGGDDKSRLRKEVHSLPKLLKIANECIESVAGIGQPIYVDYEQILAESFPDLG